MIKMTHTWRYTKHTVFIISLQSKLICLVFFLKMHNNEHCNWILTHIPSTTFIRIYRKKRLTVRDKQVARFTDMLVFGPRKCITGIFKKKRHVSLNKVILCVGYSHFNWVPAGARNKNENWTLITDEKVWKF